MRVKLLRSHGKNLFENHPPIEADGDKLKEHLEKDAPWIEGQVRECDDKTAHYLIRNGLGEETEEEVTKLPVHAKAKTEAPAPAPKTAPKDHK